MKMERAYVNAEKGFAICCWEAPSQKELEAIFKKAGASFEKILPVEEFKP
jgi:hypothetical protein